MLLELKVSNFAIIDRLHVEFKKGLNILSGETGAGKSVLLKSLALLMGEKALADTVRSGADRAIVEGRFDLSRRADIHQALSELGIECDEDQLIVRRLISSQGKSKVYLNGSISALSSLKEIVSPLIAVTGPQAPLIEMTGQHDNRHLQSKAYHLDLLDQYCGATPLRSSIEERVTRLNALKVELQDLENQSKERDQRLDFLTYQRDEIFNLKLQPGEELDLEAKILRLKNSSRLRDFCMAAEAVLYANDDSVLARLHSLNASGSELCQIDSALEGYLATLGQAKTTLEDLVFGIRTYARSVEGESESLLDLEERLFRLRRLEKKHGAGVETILESLKTIELEIHNLQSFDERVAVNQQESAQLSEALREDALDLHERRLQASRILVASVNAELLDLNMKGVEFCCHIEAREELTSTGLSDVEFLIRSGRDDQPRALVRFASGGELSRILLALKRVIGSSNQPRTYLFDEVDAGVSGQTAEKVGRKLKSIAKGSQVICVTHLPQVAAFADAHFLIDKSVSTKGALLSVKELCAEDRVRELARLISGEKITKTSLEHARSLLRPMPGEI